MDAKAELPISKSPDSKLPEPHGFTYSEPVPTVFTPSILTTPNWRSDDPDWRARKYVKPISEALPECATGEQVAYTTGTTYHFNGANWVSRPGIKKVKFFNPEGLPTKKETITGGRIRGTRTSTWRPKGARQLFSPTHDLKVEPAGDGSGGFTMSGEIGPEQEQPLPTEITGSIYEAEALWDKAQEIKEERGKRLRRFLKTLTKQELDDIEKCKGCGGMSLGGLDNFEQWKVGYDCKDCGYVFCSECFLDWNQLDKCNSCSEKIVKKHSTEIDTSFLEQNTVQITDQFNSLEVVCGVCGKSSENLFCCMY